jgi:2-methylisocitrate lyase-like PEP mutase family enzyme
MDQAGRARVFANLHQAGNPLVLYNAWDAGSAAAIAKAGAPAIATGSWSVAAAQGYRDGEQMPLDLLVQIVVRIAASVDLPLSVDFESGYARSPADVADNLARIVDAGAIGINLEDQIIGERRVYDVAEQCQRIAAVRRRADTMGVPLFINARTDLFLLADEPAAHGALVDEAIARASAYDDAGASGFFVPGLIDEALIETVCGASPLPVNIMMRSGAPGTPRLAELGVARVSYGPAPWAVAMETLTERARAALTAAPR